MSDQKLAPPKRADFVAFEDNQRLLKIGTKISPTEIHFLV
jgi:hypothetical protein